MSEAVYEASDRLRKEMTMVIIKINAPYIGFGGGVKLNKANVNAPCYGCPNREFRCHGKCEKYKEYKLYIKGDK